MRYAWVVFLLAGCAVDRDLSEGRFDCATGGPCDAADGGTSDAGRDAGPDVGPPRDGGPPTCLPGWGLADACGGDLDGAWQLRETCGAGWFAFQLREICPGASVMTATVSVTGRVAFDVAAGTYNVFNEVEAAATFDAALLCSRDPCTETEAYITITLGGGSTDCTRTGDRCHCMYEGTVPFDWSGELEVDGNEFTLDPNSAGEIVFPYCVDGTQLTYAQRGTTFVAER